MGRPCRSDGGQFSFRGSGLHGQGMAHGLAQGKVADGKNVGMAAAEHQINLGRPRPYPLMRNEIFHRLVGRQPFDQGEIQRAREDGFGDGP